MIDFIDILGDRHGAVTEYSIRHGVNGEKSISGTVYTNDEVIHGVDRGWRLEIDNEFYVITFAVPVDSGNETQLEFDAVHEFFYEFSKKNVYSTLNGSNTAVRYLDFIFNGSGYQYNLEVTIPAFEKEEFGMTNRLALFNDFIKSTGVEFVVNNRVVRILREVGTDLSTIVKKGFNMQELRLEKNLKDFVTYKRGFGAWNNDEDQSQGRLEAVYRSPLADLYGELEDEPLVDERFSVKANLEERLQSDVENSYSISVQLTMEDLTKAGYEYEQPRTGDYIMAMNEDLGFEQKIRIVNYESHYDVNGQLIDHDITCNSLGIAQKNIGSAGLRNTINQALDNANLALERANYAVVSADGKTTNYFGEDDPLTLGYEVRFKDTWYQIIGEDKVMNVWNGAEWEPITDTRVSKRNAELIAEQQAALEEVKTTADYSYDQLQQTIANSGFTDLDTAFGNVKTLSEQAESNAYNAYNAIENFETSVIGPTGRLTLAEQFIDGFRNTAFDPSTGQLSLTEQTINGLQDTVSDPVNGLETKYTQLSGLIDLRVTSEQARTISEAEILADKTIKDTRNDNQTPEWYFDNYPKQVVEEFKYRNVIGAPGSQTYGQLTTNIPWSDSSGGYVIQIFKSADGTFERRGRFTSWNEWEKIADTTYVQSQFSILDDKIFAKVSEGDVYSQLLIDSRNILFDANDRFMISANKVVIDATEGAFITSAIIEGLSADKITAGTIDANVANIININADEIVSGNITGININGSKITNDFDIEVGGDGMTSVRMIGSTVIEGDIRTSASLTDGGTLTSYFDPIGVGAIINNSDGSVRSSYALDASGLYLQNGSVRTYVGDGGFRLSSDSNPVGGTLQYEPSLARIQLASWNGVEFGSLDQGYYRRIMAVTGFPSIDFFYKVNMQQGRIEDISELVLRNSQGSKSGSRIRNTSDNWLMMGGKWGTKIGDLSIDGDTLYEILRLPSSGSAVLFRDLNMNGNMVTNQSDARFKTNINDYKESSLEMIKSLNFVTFEYTEKDKPEGVHFGLLAQEAGALGIYDKETDKWMINSSDQIMHNTHGLQELTLAHENVVNLASKAYLKAESNEERIEALEAELKQLKGELE
ncbi:hypothetical protein BKP56_07215 [Marinilactibacillus sp. 15R]|uniref:phage tail protein n=1 Tax=Marinilactibacillus sp. 15R TaxID=1911586 RepID=UPI00090A0E67|nr:phage tail protein [Marinilactibacillus sp. 15R]API89055.1 hypothetical protein BKP56_07215 [Marinilactibacillus sp. 15R]